MAGKKKTYGTAKAATIRTAKRVYEPSNPWRQVKGNTKKWGEFIVWQPVDPYSAKERKSFRAAMDNGYVYRACKIHTSFVCGRGYTTQIVPRSEEDLPDEQRIIFEQQGKIQVPYFDREMTLEEVKDYVDRLCEKMQLQTNFFNAEMSALEQGRAVIAISPMEHGEDGKWQMPEQLRFIRNEHLMRPLLDDHTGELRGVEAVTAITDEFNNVIPAERMIYIQHGFNFELFADFYGDSKVARVADEANALNVILNEDYPNAAKYVWSKPRVFSVPIAPEDFGNEDGVLTAFTEKINEGQGKDVAVTGPMGPEDPGVQLLTQGQSGSADISGLEIARTGLIKEIVSAFGLPAFMVAEGDQGTLGGNANLSELDTYLNTEISSDREMAETIIEEQLYDRILGVLFQTEDIERIPIKITHRFNKPKLWTLLTPDMFQVLTGMVQLQFIDEDGLREFLGLEEFKQDTITDGSDKNPSRGRWDGNDPWARQMPQVQGGWRQNNGWIPPDPQFGWARQPTGWEQSNITTKPNNSWTKSPVNW